MSMLSTPCGAVRIAVVTVTYGSRWHLLKQVLAALEAEPLVHRVTVVDNGAVPPVRDLINGCSFERLCIQVIELGANRGSAGGFAAGIKVACRYDDCTHLFLLDDDNKPETGCISALAQLHVLASHAGPVVLSAMRKGRKEYERILTGATAIQIPSNSFLGFHVRSVLRKVVAKLGGNRKGSGVLPSRVRQLSVAPYGGLFLEIALALKVGLPRSEFLLYGDDHDYTARLRDEGAQLLLTDLATLQDLDDSWSESSMEQNPWVQKGAPAWRAYYAARNRMILETRFTDSPLTYRINQLVYLCILSIFALRSHRSIRRAYNALRPVLDAISDAKSGRLGERENYQIPQPKPTTPDPALVGTEWSAP